MIDRRRFIATGALLAAAARFDMLAHAAGTAEVEDRVAALLRRMTLAEKIGQLTQIAGGRQRALNSKLDEAMLARVRKGEIGSFLHVAGAEPLRALQQVAVKESRLGIPLLFAMDVVHGFRTIFPVPLAIAASWDVEAARTAARVAAVETAISGLHWTFAPMVDVARDPRWGRIVEGAGEDPHLGSAMAVAQVRGYQGENLGGRDSILACAKHFVGYGAAMGGRDYDSADVSERTLHEVYLPPFHAAAQAGAGSMMVAFNDVGGVPMTAHGELIRGLLRKAWGYDGLIVSDWNAVIELVNHGIAADEAGAAEAALRAGIDMEMASTSFSTTLATTIGRDAALVPLLDQAVANVLRAKARLGLFDDPFRFGDPAREKTELGSPAHRAAAREVARKSIVLLRNEGSILPLKPGTKVALIGALADDASSALGSWRARGQVADVVTLRAALEKSGLTVVDQTTEHGPFGQPVLNMTGFAVDRTADVVLFVTGEDFDQSGEARSRSDIGPTSDQLLSFQRLRGSGKPVVVILMNGRPLALEAILKDVPAVLESWFLGIESGPAIVDVLTGKVSPAGRLPAAFPRNPGQSPLPYAHFPTGRPANPDLAIDSARYRDVDVGPLFPFGHGLSYTRFDYGPIALDRSEIGADGAIRITVPVTNAGKVAGDEVVQLYLRDPVASVARPVKELRGFARVPLAPGETKRVTFTLSAAQTAIWYPDGWRIEAGRIELMVGASSEDIRQRAAFTITRSGKASVPAAAILTEVRIA